MTDIALVWKVPEEPVENDPYMERGVFPSGELMAVCSNREEATRLKHHLEDNSPSKRFGETMEDAPYRFQISYRNLYDHDLHE